MDPPEHTDSPLSASLLPRDSSDRKATNQHKFRTGAKDLFVCILSFKNAASIATGPIVAISLWRFLHIGSDDTGRAAAMVAVISWVFIWWMTEAIPIAVTSLAPLFLLPVMQIQTASEVSKSYMNDTVFLLIGSFMLATAIEHYDLHRRMAMKLLTLLGGKLMDPWLLLLGFCVGPGFVSMWVHNTAAAVMMMPVGLGVLEKAMSTINQVTDEEMEVGEKRQDEGEDFSAAFLGTMEARGKEVEKMHVTRFAKAVVLAIGYAATIGGMATLTGTGVNLILAGLYESYFPEAEQITYLQWMMFGLPMACLLLVFLWLLLCVWFCPRSSVPSIARSLQDSHVLHDIASMGPISFAEIAILGVFGILILLWLTRSMGDFGGWSDLFNDYVGNGSVSILMATFLFIIPNRRREGEKLLSWSHCKAIPWGIILMLGGGFALANGMSASGLSDVISEQLDFLQDAPFLLVVPVIAILTSAMTEFTSNNSAATIFVSLLAQVASSIGLHPLFLMVPAAAAAQFSFMLPIATPANAIAYSSGYLSSIDMLLVGFFLKLFGIVSLSIVMPSLGAAVFKTNV